MPTFAAAEASNATFAPSYIPVAVFAGGTSGVGEAMAAALARYTKGRAHIILIGRSAAAAEKILAGFPKPADSEEEGGWAHEFVPCDASSMVNVRRVCSELRARLNRINFLVMSAAGPKGNSVVECGETEEGLDDHLAMRYFSRYVYSKELMPLLVSARGEGQPAHLMTIQGAGMGYEIGTSDLGLVAARRASIKFLQGYLLSFAAMKGVMRGAAYNDGLVAWFAAQQPDIACTHIAPGHVRTPGSNIKGGWFFKPLARLITGQGSISQDECAPHMLHALLDGTPGVFIRDSQGDTISSHVFTADKPGRFVDDSPTARKVGFLNGVQLKGYDGSDVTVAALIEYTEQVLAEIK